MIGTASSFVFVRRPSRPTTALELGAMVPAMLPPLLIGVALLTAMAAFDIAPSLRTVTLGHVVYVIPFVIVIVAARLRSIDQELEQAARDLGASPLETLRRVTLPALLPAIVGAGLLAFAFSFDEVLITTFTIGLDPTLPMYVISRMRRTIDPSVNAVATVLLAVPWISVVLYLVITRLLNRSGASGSDPLTAGKPDHGMTESDTLSNIVSVVGVTRRYDDVMALADVSFEIPAGSFFALLGPSGCGKTTLLRVLAGLDRPDEGDVLLDGRSIIDVPPERRPFNIVFQRYALFPHMTVIENVAFGLTTGGRGRGRQRKLDIASRVDAMLTLVGLEGLGSRYPAQLSGGQAQRVALSRALINEPRMLLLDEPLSALDRNVRISVREELQRIHYELGTTFLLVTHDQEEALGIATRVALMNHGRLEQLGEAEDLYRRPATLFAARFIGAGTFLTGVAGERRGDSVDVAVGSISWSPRTAEMHEGSDVVVMLRPEDVRLTAESDARTSATVETCAYVGASYEVTASSPHGLFRLSSPASLTVGERVFLGWDADAGLCYGAATNAENPERKAGPDAG